MQTPIVHNDIKVIMIRGFPCGLRLIEDPSYSFGAVRLSSKISDIRAVRRAHMMICQKLVEMLLF
jgi:hypothetical protein